MKALFFHATSHTAHPSVLGAFQGQTRSTLQSFTRFLGQAIHTAKSRQTRYELPWESVRHLQTLTLTSIDSLLRVPRRPPATVLVGWPEGERPDIEQAAFVVNRGVPVRLDGVVAVPNGLRVHAEPPLLPGDRVVWCSVTMEAQREEEPEAPAVVLDIDGQALTLLGAPTVHEERWWLLRVAGQLGDCDLLVDGEEVEAEALPAGESLRRVTDASGRVLDVSGGTLRVDELPAEGALLGDDGLRYEATRSQGDGRRGNWVQLLPPERTEADEHLDPRAAFCEGDVREVWTDPRRHKAEVLRVKRVDQERYQLLLHSMPPRGSKLFLPVDLRNLFLQRRALRQLAEAPLPHHRGLLRLCEDPRHARWPAVAPMPIDESEWRSLTDPTRSGTEQQRQFVRKALGTPDFAFLEGPPGSGKTTAICELVQQLVLAGQRVLLCASTHVAIDNVLERLLGGEAPIDAVRVGRLDKVDDAVQACQLDSRIDGLVARWRELPAMVGYGTDQLREMASRTVVMAANLTCGTTMGIVNHPLFRGRDQDVHVAERPISTMPHWDVLIIDEASKTLIQEFLVPALMAKRWIVVGDVRQLPPFADRADIVANLRSLVDRDDREIFPHDHQRASLLMFRLLRPQLQQRGMRWLLVEPPGVLDFLGQELLARATQVPAVVRVVSRPSASPTVREVTVQSLRRGAMASLYLAAAHWVLVGEDLIGEVSALLPGNLLLSRDLLGLAEGRSERLEGDDALWFRQGYWLSGAGSLETPYNDRQGPREGVRSMEEAQACESTWLTRHDVGSEIAWRLTRLHELRHSKNQRERDRLRRAVDRLRPRAVDISESISEIEDIGLPSILEVLQEGIGVARSNRPSALTAGMRASSERDFVARFESLTFQHRMHPEISAFSREMIYGGAALQDANTIAQRDAGGAWSFEDFGARRVWLDVQGRESGGVNADEVRAIESVLKDFVTWAKRQGPPDRESGLWEVACLSFYAKQERGLSEMLQRCTGDDRKTRFRVSGAPVEIVCGTVDRFQGREADLVLLSMRNTSRTGFLDSPNRLNVAVTRARQQLVVVGKADYFRGCGIAELEQLVQRTRVVGSTRHEPRRNNR